MPRTTSGLMDLMVRRDFLEAAADEAVKAVRKRPHGKEPRYLKEFLERREECLDEIQNMLVLGYYPGKRYMRRQAMTNRKVRDLATLPFHPWSIVMHAMKRALEPVVERVLIKDSSAGTRGRGQVFAALRVKGFIRRHSECTHVVVADIRKYYESIPHDVVERCVGRYVRDRRFMDLFRAVMLDYVSDVEPALLEERERKLRLCKWADRAPFITGRKRGVTIGGSGSQLVGNICLARVDHVMKRVHKAVFYHRHCDDIVMGARSKEEGERLLAALDREMNALGLVLKASSRVFPLLDESRGGRGERLDFCGYVFSRRNMRMRKATKKRFARKLHGVKSRRRRREIVAAYWGIAKWGKCANLWKTILGQNGIMSFADVGIRTEPVTTGKDGKRIFDVPTAKVGALADAHAEIVVMDFEEGVTVKGQPGRCVVLFHYPDNDEPRKFMTTSSRIIEKLRRARELEAQGTTKVFPQPTRVLSVRLGNGRFTYDLE